MSIHKWHITPATTPAYTVLVALYESSTDAAQAANAEILGSWTENAKACTNMHFNGEDIAVKVYLSKPDVTVQILAHEFTHAAIHCATLDGAAVYNAADETVPHVVSDLLDGANEIGLLEVARINTTR